jgi:hypothetical protein
LIFVDVDVDDVDVVDVDVDVDVDVVDHCGIGNGDVHTSSIALEATEDKIDNDWNSDTFDAMHPTDKRNVLTKKPKIYCLAI